ncbi:MAG: hypothetical protein HY775_00005, partial [Acidobacteria bacterium]|nr:hypothetical protein [Acidobacteriota bacterium]
MLGLGRLEESERISGRGCPGNKRAGDKCNPQYSGTFVFDNDFAALLPDPQEANLDERGLIRAE